MAKKCGSPYTTVWMPIYQEEYPEELPKMSRRGKELLQLSTIYHISVDKLGKDRNTKKLKYNSDDIKRCFS